MDKRENSITILTCNGKGKKATKKFIKQEDGSIKKVSFNAGMFFTHEERPVFNLQDLANVINDIADDQRKLIIRGQIKGNMPPAVRRKTHEPEAAFDAIARPYVMLDIDKMGCPAFFNPETNPEEIVRWVLHALPEPFKKISCFYKFSSSQNVLGQGSEAGEAISLHLWFWCNRPVSDDEWKRYFKSVSSPVDTALFSPVQIHFTANPIFENMDDPLPDRSGIFNGDSETIIVPDIPKAEIQASVYRPECEIVVTEVDRSKALELLAPYYQSGSRNKFCGAVAATLYRRGWKAENVLDFVYELAEKCLDEEADHRWSNALRICDAVDNNLPAQGIPTLKNEFNVKELDEILDLLGLGNPDISSEISKLNNQSSISDIKLVLLTLLSLPKSEQSFYLDKISKQAFQKKGTLTSLLKETRLEQNKKPPIDLNDILMEVLLSAEYEGGENLLYTSDRSYWHYNDQYWEMIPAQQIKQLLLSHARQFIAEIKKGSVSSFNNTVINILEGRVFRQNDPLGRLNFNLPSVINCQNGELWLSDDGNIQFKPHRSDSYLRHCLNIDYDPAATSPMFDKAALEIFSNSSDPADMFRHFMELAGYICQPWRKIPIIVLLYGGGSNGKTSLVKIIRRMLGDNTVMSDRLDKIEGNDFKIGDLDGKLLLLDDDVDGGTCIPDGFLKKISEEKAMTGQHKHKDPFEFICRAVPVMLANDYPVTSDLTKGLRRRLRVIPFNRTFEPHEIKVDLFDQIWEQEASGILNHVIAGFQRVRKRGDFFDPKDCALAKDEWISRANILATFIKEECELGEDHRVHLGDFYNAFKEYCREGGVRNTQTRRGVEGRLEALGYRIRMLDGKKAVWGLKLSIDALRRNSGGFDVRL
jgi:P4 family phage/plasmid primase-like protien